MDTTERGENLLYRKIRKCTRWSRLVRNFQTIVARGSNE